MKIISHRGNLLGPDKFKENTEQYLIDALNSGFDLEFDVWFVASKFWLGHDKPEHEFSTDTLLQWASRYAYTKFYVHCKNMWALEILANMEKKNVVPFFHDSDQCILLRDNFLWVHPNAVFNSYRKDRSIAVVSSCQKAGYNIEYDIDFSDFHGICTDYPVGVRESIG